MAHLTTRHALSLGLVGKKILGKINSLLRLFCRARVCAQVPGVTRRRVRNMYRATRVSLLWFLKSL